VITSGPNFVADRLEDVFASPARDLLDLGDLRFDPQLAIEEVFRQLHALTPCRRAAFVRGRPTSCAVHRAFHPRRPPSIADAFLDLLIFFHWSRSTCFRSATAALNS
jgi:hypothetical protein